MRRVDETDRGIWVRDLKFTWFGDATLDGEFNSGDLVAVLASGNYEVDVDAVWSTGDFTGTAVQLERPSRRTGGRWLRNRAAPQP